MNNRSVTAKNKDTHPQLLAAGNIRALWRLQETRPVYLRDRVCLSFAPQYGAESWPALLFLSLVTAAFLFPAAALYWKVSVSDPCATVIGTCRGRGEGVGSNTAD